MIREIASALRWLFVLSVTFIQASPFGTTVSIVLSFLSQLALMASTLLPLKIVMIMSSGQIPTVFPDSLAQYGEKPLIASISAIAIGSFAFYNAAKSFTGSLAQRAVTRIQSRNEKLVLFENQEELAENSYLKVSSAIASVLYVSLSFAVIFWLYPELAAAIAGFFVLCFLGYALVYRILHSKRAVMAEKLNAHVNVLSNIGFLSAFLFIVANYMFASIPPFLSVLASIVLSRQLFAQTASTTISVSFCQNRKDKLRALFFKHHTFQPSQPQQKHSVWQFLENTGWRRALTQYVSTLADTESTVTYDLHWRETGLNNILVLMAEPDLSDAPQYLVKIYDRRKSAEARHEATLLMSPLEGLPAPVQFDATQMDGFHIHIMDVTRCAPVNGEASIALRKELYEQLLYVVPDRQITTQYQRSRTMLWDRVDERIIRRLEVVADSEQGSVLQRFEERLPFMSRRLSEMPLRLTINPVRGELCARNSEGRLLLLHWGKWCLEPVGAHYPTAVVTNTGTNLPDDVQRTSPDERCMAQSLGELITLFTNERYHSAYRVIDDLMQSTHA